MRLSDENTREGRHLTPEERIALQAEEIKQLRAQVARTKGNLCLLCVGCEAEPENGTIECNSFVCRNKARCHNPNDVEALRKAREALEQTKGFIKGIGCYCNCEGEYASQCQPCFIVEQIDKTLATIDKALGGGESD